MDHLIGDVEVKEEPIYTPETQSPNSVVPSVKPIFEIKEEPNDINDQVIIDDSIKVEENCVNEVKLEADDLPPSQEIETVYLNESNIVASPAIFCYRCNQRYTDFCPGCPMLIRILDTMVKQPSPDRAIKTLPNNFLQLGENGGVFTKRVIPIGVTFGPFQGLKDVKIIEGRYFFPVRNQQIVSTDSYENTNWLRFIRIGLNFKSNLVMIESGGQLFYRTRAAVREGEQLLVQTTVFDENMVYFDPIKIDRIGPVYPCLMCCLGFSLKIYLRRHLKKCPHLGISNFNILEEHSRIESIPQLVPLTDKPIPDIPNGSTNLYQCCICNKKFKGLNNLKHHSNRTHSITDDIGDVLDVIKCSLCNAIFDNQVDYIVHRHSIHPDSLSDAARCEICNKTFPTEQSLSEHIQTHIDETPNVPWKWYRCTKCPKTCRNVKTYKAHMAYHKVVNGKKEVMKKVNENKKLSCAKCSKSFPNQKELDKHASQHSKNRRTPKLYKCSYCNFHSERKCIDFVQHMLHKYDNVTPGS